MVVRLLLAQIVAPLARLRGRSAFKSWRRARAPGQAAASQPDTERWSILEDSRRTHGARKWPHDYNRPM